MIRMAHNREVVAQGRRCLVEFAVRTSGRKEAKDFLETLKTSTDFHGHGEQVERKLRVFVTQMADLGRLRKSSQFGKEQGEIYAFKYEAFNQLIRIPCFSYGGSWVLTHGFFKHGAQRGKGRWRAEYIKKAETIMREHKKLFPL